MAFGCTGGDSDPDCLLVSLPVLLHDAVIHRLGRQLLGGCEDVDLVEAQQVPLDDLKVLEAIMSTDLDELFADGLCLGI